MLKIKNLLVCAFWLLLSTSLYAQTLWSIQSYPDEALYQQRISGMLEIIANKPFLDRSKSTSRCPDTGKLVYYWAIEGDTIISPYTGRKFVQGSTGYFGAKARGLDGRIIKFGGDPLNYDLPPAMARLLLNKADSVETKAFLSIPGNLNQQYHFAAKNWARFYPLLSHKMGEQWIQEFQDAVG
ncbi:MAG: hypothetical protein ACFCUU_14440, partial [Cyclobacteriaceae bacterium]